ncbi:MAG: hypothetical protein NVS3B18_05880 [Candidatus Dormibacteria bacterium]
MVTAVGVAAFGGVYGLAASLSLTSDSLGAGTVVVASCQSTAMNATYGAATYAPSAYGVTSVTVTGLTSTCYGKPYKITLQGASGASLGEATGTTPTTAGTTSFPVTFSPSISAASVIGVAMVVSG